MTDAILAPDLINMFRAISARMNEDRDYLSELDGQIGDADHGTSMAQGFAAVVRALHDADLADAALSDLFAIAARSFLNAVGASTGPLYASALLSAAAFVGDARSLTPAQALQLIEAMSAGIAKRGKAAPGDKTMMDAWSPAAHAIRTGLESGLPPEAVLARASAAARAGSEATRAMIASRGRASRLGERSLGHLDPGATSAAAIIEVIAAALCATGKLGPQPGSD
ncbi:MAG: dihydroxyacetone kinase subunit DhaL [Cypionkella sp.]